MNFIPESLFHKIMLFNSHPVADLYKTTFEHLLDKSQMYDPDHYSFDMMWTLQEQMRKHEEAGDPEYDEELYGESEDED